MVKEEVKRKGKNSIQPFLIFLVRLFMPSDNSKTAITKIIKTKSHLLNTKK